ncbi:sugar transferase [Phormidium sp. LEGE 05292]|uniref:heterocyst development glycosyltransferase HepC n=1 Tax=[Phormidium] sp. LEGE 05292 TaxID=767427 RepID=UPI00187EC0C9|nr:heterocyst development glycosyltransferase HepC [Phormidium sp. LEGE 05292]MBE9225213.1 sugar transferase [Phormidium sp. LEGE 05292]
MTSLKVSTLKELIPGDRQNLDYSVPKYVLKWRLGKLVVSSRQGTNQPQLPALENRELLVKCLQNSPVRLVLLDPDINEAQLRLWADASEQANKPVFLRLPSAHGLPRMRNPISWGLKRLFDWSVAALLLTALTPLMFALAILIRTYSPGPIFYTQWRVGERGKLFRILKFRTMIVDAEKFHHQVMANQQGLHKCKDDFRVTPLGRWMRKYSVDELPQLVNVLRGEMSLVGPRPWALYDAIRINKKGQKRLNALPGITGDWQVTARSNLLDLEAVNHCDLEYLRSWSLWRDLKILPLTMLKVISGFGAY